MNRMVLAQNRISTIVDNPFLFFRVFVLAQNWISTIVDSSQLKKPLIVLTQNWISTIVDYQTVKNCLEKVSVQNRISTIVNIIEDEQNNSRFGPK